MSIRVYLLAAATGLPTVMVLTGAWAQTGTAPQPNLSNAVGPSTSTASSPKDTDPLANRAPVRRESAPLPRRSNPNTANDQAPAAIPAMPQAAQPAPAATWSKEEIAAAKAHCAVVLYGIEAKTEPEDPIKEGACGSPHVVRLVSIGKSPEVVLNPPATLTCDMVAALHRWLKADLQPLARRELGGSIVKLENMSSYSCRNAYGRARTNLSEHGRANALDLGGFATSSGDTTRVLASWGPTLREIRALAGSGQGGQNKTAVEPANAQPAQLGTGAAGVATVKNTPQVTTITPTPTAPAHLPGVIIRSLPGLDHGSGAFGLAPPSRLGAPKPKDEPAGPADAPKAQGKQLPKITRPDAKATSGSLAELDPKRTRFLRDAHATACKHFGTVLGPEANKDHLNHFHLDMAPRRTGNFCQ